MRKIVAIAAGLSLLGAVALAQGIGGGGGGGGGGSGTPGGNPGDIQFNDGGVFGGYPVLPAAVLPWTLSGDQPVVGSVDGAFVTGNAVVTDAAGNFVDAGVPPGSATTGGSGTNVQYRIDGTTFGGLPGSAIQSALGGLQLQGNTVAAITAVTCNAGLLGTKVIANDLTAWDTTVVGGGNLSGPVECTKTGAATYAWKGVINTTATSTTIDLAPGLASNDAACNDGTQTMTDGSTLSLQLCATPIAVNTSPGATDTSKLYIPTVADVEITLPAAGTANRRYNAGGNGSARYIVNATSGSIYGCGATVTAGNDLLVQANEDVQFFDDGTNYKCVKSGARLLPIALTYAPGTVAGAYGMAHIRQDYTVVDIRCTPEIVAGGAATADVYKAPSGTAIGSGTKLNTTAFNANTGAFTAQDLSVAVATVASGDRIGLNVIAGAGWGTSSPGTGICTVTVR